MISFQPAMQDASMKLSLGFGLRLRGLDLLTSLRVDHDGHRHDDGHEELQLEDVASRPRKPGENDENPGETNGDK